MKPSYKKAAHNYAVKTFLFKGPVPAFAAVGGVYYQVCEKPLNSGNIPDEPFRVLLVNTETRLVYVGILSSLTKVSCLYFDTETQSAH